MKKIITAILLSASFFSQAHAGDNDQLVQLNNKIQAQLKEMNDQQQKQIIQLNTQVNAQMQKLQADLQKTIADSNKNTLVQLQQLQTEIQQLQTKK